MRTLRSVALASVIGLTCVSLPAIAKEAPVDDARLVEILSDPQAILSVIPALPDSITKVDPTVVRVFIYNERKRPETEALASVTESRLSEELLRLHRFKVIDARDVRAVHIQSDNTTFSVSNTIESTARLRKIGETMGADGVLMFTPQLQDRMVLIQAKLVRVTDGEILWTERFAYNFDLARAEAEESRRAEEASRLEADRKRLERLKITQANGIYVMPLLTLEQMVRKATDGSKDVSAPIQLGFNAQFMGTFPAFEHLSVAFPDVQVAASLGGTDLQVVMLNPGVTAFWHLDPMFNKGVNDGNFSAYLGLGWPFTVSPRLALGPGATGKIGLRVRVVEKGYMDLGIQYIPTWKLNFDASPKYASDLTWGGDVVFAVTLGGIVN